MYEVEEGECRAAEPVGRGVNGGWDVMVGCLIRFHEMWRTGPGMDDLCWALVKVSFYDCNVFQGCVSRS